MMILIIIYNLNMFIIPGAGLKVEDANNCRGLILAGVLPTAVSLCLYFLQVSLLVPAATA
jgi:hypothetical protein